MMIEINAAAARAIQEMMNWRDRTDAMKFFPSGRIQIPDHDIVLTGLNEPENPKVLQAARQSFKVGVGWVA